MNERDRLVRCNVTPDVIVALLRSIAHAIEQNPDSSGSAGRSNSRPSVGGGRGILFQHK